VERPNRHSSGHLDRHHTGLTAQAEGAGARGESRATLVRALILGGGLGLVILAFYPLIRAGALAAFDASAPVERLAGDYFAARIWGAPAALMGYAITGWLIGTGRTRGLLGFQLVLNGINAGLDAWFVAALDLGPAGIGAGTALAEWAALGFGLLLVRDGFRVRAKLWDRARLAALLVANRDIMVRTLALLFAFAWFTNAGAKVGTAALAGNEVLLQFIAVSAFVLDAFAFVAEKEAGQAYGARDRARFLRALRITSELAAVSGLAIAFVYCVGGGWVIEVAIADPAARDAALAYLPWCAGVPLIGWVAYQLDGVFLGTTQGAALRNAGVAATLAYVVCDLVLRPQFGNAGVWAAFLSMFVWRALFLGAYLPHLIRALGGARPDPVEAGQ
jgi:multidrug resistance protein, MATE family